MADVTTLTPHQQAALNYSRHISLTANAGSGKTFILSKRYLEIALNENIPLRSIAAITFTDKAASELYSKIVKQIDDRVSIAQDKEVVNKLERIRRQLVSASISTIHSFCMDILREFPVEAGLDANFSAIDETESDELIELCVDDLIKKSLIGGNVEKLKYLIRVFASRSLFVRELTSLIKKRKNVQQLAEKLYSNSEKQIAGHFHKSFIDLLDKLILKDQDEFVTAVTRINDTVLNHDKKNEFAVAAQTLLKKLKSQKKPEENLSVLLNLAEAIATKGYTVKVRGYLSAKLSEGLEVQVETANRFLKSISKLNISSDDKTTELALAKFGKTISEFFSEAVELYDQRKLENGFLDYEDILLLTQKILEQESVRKSLGEKYKYIMVDEYQDTNEIQYNIFLPILDHLKKGNLFVVGDEKQSIYRFRDAELEVFTRTQKDIKKSSGENYLLSLPDSFRMSPAVCVFVNHIFRNLFESPEEYFNEVNHSDIVCARDENPYGKVEFLLTQIIKKYKVKPGKENEDQSAEESENPEAELIANKIMTMTQSSSEIPVVEFKDIAILVRKRKHFSDFEKVFTEYNIPFTIVGGKGFYQRQIIYDIYNYFSFLLNRDNDAALLGLLRSPFYLLSDTKIFEMSVMQGESLWQKLKVFQKNSDEIKTVVSKLEGMISFTSVNEIITVLRKILTESDFLPVINSSPAGEQELANLDKLIKLTMDFSTNGFNTLYDYVDFLRDSLESMEDESQAALSEESASVKIMTLHQAKGLEFPVVLLYKCDEAPMIDTVKAKSISVNKEFGLLTKVPINDNYSGEYKAVPLLALADMVTRKRESAELKRLLYVGVTRAKAHLIISASTDEEYSFPDDSFMQMIVEGLGEEISGESVNIKSKLSFLAKNEKGYSTIVRQQELVIPIIKAISGVKPVRKSDSQNEIIPEFNLDEIKDVPEGEIISATKYAVFTQCPVKYQLIYETGYSEIAKQYKDWDRSQNKKNNSDVSFELSEKENVIQKRSEDENYAKSYLNNAALKGSLIHKYLQLGLSANEIISFVESEIQKESAQISASEKSALTEEIKNDLAEFMSSEVFNKINSAKDFKNEIEVYVKEKDFYLYGIIDKLIIDKNHVQIVDYKTDNVSENEIVRKSEHYLNQLKFYSYIVSRLFKNVSEISIRLIFIKHPDKEILMKMSMKEIDNLKSRIGEFVNISRTGLYNKELTHCSSCNFALNNGSCVKN